jgi:ornithine--oxo-acid transaminase
VLADRDVMLCIRPGEHGSTYGGNPLGCAVALAALDVLVREDLCARAAALGTLFRERVAALKPNHALVAEVRGRGLLNAVVIDESKSKKGRSAWHLCLLLKSRGVLAKPTHQNMYVRSSFPGARADAAPSQHPLRAAARDRGEGPAARSRHVRGVPG